MGTGRHAGSDYAQPGTPFGRPVAGARRHSQQGSLSALSVWACAVPRAGVYREWIGSSQKDSHTMPEERNRRGCHRRFELVRPRPAGGRHRPGAGHGRRREIRQRPPRHGHEPGAGRLPALQPGDAP